MIIEPFLTEDVVSFLQFAAAENWVAEPWEFEFLQSSFPGGCFVARGNSGETAGFVTSLRHEQSGWIGNLIVKTEYRGRGFGETLFRKALEALWMDGAQTIWLTASKSGMPLYEKHGFTAIDTIMRWVGTGRRHHKVHHVNTDREVLAGPSQDLDAHAWGDCRITLLEATARRGVLLQDESGFIVQQPCGDAVQIGPFSAVDSTGAERLFEDSAKNIPLGTKLLLDSPASNKAALVLLNNRKMRITGSSSLMFAGKKPDYRPELIYGLATMGSCG